MTLHQLKLFAAIAKHRSVTKAAQILHTSQPSVSQQVGLLEDEIGKVLFKNNGHGIELTDAGYELLKRVEPILSQLEELKKTTLQNPVRTKNWILFWLAVAVLWPRYYPH